ncbi:MAG TPA: DUF3108 domain-containing protein [Bacteroidales bacterium]|nr:DUF3108 domain-containing protein [Bacteroidales bacterium]
MKTHGKIFGKYCLIAFIMIMTGFAVAVKGQDMRTINNTAFNPGEKLVFRAYYNSTITGNVLAGDAVMEIYPETEVINGRTAMRVVCLMRTRGVFSLFFRVNNRFESYIDQEAIAPLVFKRNLQEGNYTRNQDVRFNHIEGVASTNDTVVPIPAYVQDVLSAFYFARTLALQNPREGQEFAMDFFHGDSVYVTRIVFDGYDRIRTRLGTFNTLRFKPMMVTGNVFSQPFPMTLWVTNDANRVPIRIETGLKVGNLRLELSEFHGLRNQLTSKAK